MINGEGLVNTTVGNEPSVKSVGNNENIDAIYSGLDSMINGTQNPDDMYSSLDDMIKEDTIKGHLAKSTFTGEPPKDEDLTEGMNTFKKIWYYKDEITRGAFLGRAKAIESTGKFFFDILGDEDGKGSKLLSNFMGQAEKELKTNTVIGGASEVAGQVGTGILATGGLNPLGLTSKVALAGQSLFQGGIIDGIFFDEKSGNVADVLKDFGVDNAVVDYLSSKDSDEALEARFKNALTGAGIGVTAESIFSVFRLFKGLKKADEVADEMLNGVKVETTEVTKSPEEIINEAYTRVVKESDEALKKLDPIEERIARIDPKDNLPKPLSTSDDLLKKAEDIVNDIKASDSTLDNPPINPKNAQGNVERFMKAIEGTEKDVTYRSQQEAMKLAQEVIDGTNNADELMQEIADQVKYQDVKSATAKMLLAVATKNFQESAEKAFQNPSSVSSLLELVNSLEKFNHVSTGFANYAGEIGRGLSMLNYSPKERAINKFYKVLDTVDAEQSYLLFKKALEDGKIDQSVIDKVYGAVTKAGELRNIVDNYQDGWLTKTMNVLSEGGIASMISGIPTMSAVGILGNGLVKAMDFGLDLHRFVISNVTRSDSAMKIREAKALLNSHTYQSFYDAKASMKLLKDWANSKFSDDVFDKDVFIRFAQDQEVHHKYASSEYLRGEAGTTDSGLNTAINVYGKVTRSVYKPIEVVDDIFKRGAFRTELIRQGSMLADIKKLSDVEYNKFIDGFVRANTELQLLSNNKMNPSKEWLKKNKEFVGTGDGTFMYANTARDKAKYLTLQEEIGGQVGKAMEILNSNGLLRILYPFKTITVNSLDMAGETAFPFLYKKFRDEFKAGGVKRDTAIAKLTMTAEILGGAYALVQSGKVTGSYITPEESKAYAEAGIPSNSFSFNGKDWHDYRQYEPMSTILGVMSDMHNLVGRFQAKKDFVPEAEYMSLVGDSMKEFLMVTANNIANKTFAKNLSDQLDIIHGNKNATDFAGNLMSSTLPFSGLSTSMGRFFGDGIKYEPKTFTERVFKAYRVGLDRKALDAFGQEVPEIAYTPILTKVATFTDAKYDTRKEMLRLGVMPKWDINGISMNSVDVRLNKDEKYEAIKILNSPEVNYQGNMDAIINSEQYKSSNDFIRKEMLEKAKSMIFHGATMMLKDSLQNRLVENAQLKIKEMEQQTKGAKYSTILKRIK